MTEQNERPAPLRLVTGHPSDRTPEEGVSQQGYTIDRVTQALINMLVLIRGDEPGPEATTRWITSWIDSEVEQYGGAGDLVEAGRTLAQ